MNDFALILLHFDYFLLFLQQFEDLQILAATTGKRERRRVFGRKKMEIYERRVTSMEKLLAMVLALVMTLSLAVSANAFKDDKSISDDYAEAVAVLNGMGVFKGYEDGSFQPAGDITRAEVSAIVYRVYTQDVKDAKASMYATYNKFSDMAGAGWAQGYIGYCANASLVKGYPDGTFKPSGKVTGYEVLAMILRAVGYDKNNEFSGADWALHVAQTAQQLGVLKNIKGVDLNAAASRELVAELLFRAIAEASTVNYTPAFGYVTDKVLKLDESTLGYKNFKLVGKADADSFGRPATKWTYNVGDKSTLVVAKADASYTTKVDECDIAKDLGITSSKKIPMRSTRLARLRLPPSSPLSPTSSRSLLSLTASTRSRWVPTTRSAVLISSWAPMAMATPLPVLLLRSSMN